jgi:hypothetical protein
LDLIAKETSHTTKEQRMKTTKWIHSAIMALTLAMSGCNKHGGVDTALFEKSFKTAEATAQTSADKVVTAIKSADYSGALAELKTLANNAKLSTEQQQAIKDVMAQVEKAIADAASKATGEAGKAMKDTYPRGCRNNSAAVGSPKPNRTLRAARDASKSRAAFVSAARTG